MSEASATPTVASVRLPRLSAPRAVGSDPTFEELRLGPLEEECLAWHFDRTGSTMWELNARAGSDHDAWREIPILMGSSAESALLACSAEVEIECLRRAMTARELPEPYGLAQRFFAEAQAQQILGCGHRLANIAVRMLMRAPDYSSWGQPIGCPAPFTPFSDERRDWVSMSRMHDYLKAAQRSPHRSLDRLTALVIDINESTEWKALDNRRGKDFHRARDESPFVAGASRVSVWRTEGMTHILEPRDACQHLRRLIDGLQISVKSRTKRS